MFTVLTSDKTLLKWKNFNLKIQSMQTTAPSYRLQETPPFSRKLCNELAIAGYWMWQCNYILKPQVFRLAFLEMLNLPVKGLHFNNFLSSPLLEAWWPGILSSCLWQLQLEHLTSMRFIVLTTWPKVTCAIENIAPVASHVLRKLCAGQQWQGDIPTQWLPNESLALFLLPLFLCFCLFIWHPHPLCKLSAFHYIPFCSD